VDPPSDSEMEHDNAALGGEKKRRRDLKGGDSEAGEGRFSRHFQASCGRMAEREAPGYEGSTARPRTSERKSYEQTSPALKCKDSKGARRCMHGRQKTQSRECGGSHICEHKRPKSRCKECGGSQICAHGLVKSRCKECWGAQICAHGRFKRDCKECWGSRYCAHGRLKSGCKECWGSQICAHDRFQFGCKGCRGPPSLGLGETLGLPVGDAASARPPSPPSQVLRSATRAGCSRLIRGGWLASRRGFERARRLGCLLPCRGVLGR
jgi:hypothetical protein